MQNIEKDSISYVLLTTANTEQTSSLMSSPLVKFPKKKKKRITLKKYKTGRWDNKEHSQFMEAFMKHGNDWKSVESLMKRRSAEQIRSHSQKYFIKISKQYSTFRKSGKDISFDCEFDKLFMEIFRKDKKRVFFIRKVHKDHDKSVCAKRRKLRQRVFLIQKIPKISKVEESGGCLETADGNVVTSHYKSEETNEIASGSLTNEYIISELKQLINTNLKTFDLLDKEYFRSYLEPKPNPLMTILMNQSQITKDNLEFLHYIYYLTQTDHIKSV